MATIGLAPQPAGASMPSNVFTDLTSPSTTATKCSNASNYSSSVGSSQATDLSSPILEQDGESDSESPNEPATPASGRHSQEFSTAGQSQGSWHLPSVIETEHDSHIFLSITPTKESTAQPQPPSPSSSHQLALIRTVSQVSDDNLTQRCLTNASTADDCSTPLGRRASRSSTLKRTMTNLFKRTSSSVSMSQNANNQSAIASDANSIVTIDSRKNDDHRNNISVVVPSSRPNPRRWSMYRSSATTRSNTPPSPRSPDGETTPVSTKGPAAGPGPSPDDLKKRGRVSTGLESIRVRVGLPHGNRTSKGEKLRRANSLESLKQPQVPPGHQHDDSIPMIRQHLFNPPEEGVGLKARRMSLSLPDDFNVDVGNLLDEYEYNSRFGRHGKHLGKGATSKVNVMARKGAPSELYAVKEFRPRNSREDKDEYEKKVKSEYSIAKSLHHPNIVESFRLCTDGHGRWNHVMEYCSDGDLFSLVKKGYLKDEARTADRLCLFKQLVQGISYLHSHGIAHRDIKLENLLVTERCKLKLTDFGISEVFSGIHPGLREAGGQCGKGMDGEIRWSKGRCGSQPYMAPEVLIKTANDGAAAEPGSDNRYDPRAIDVWSSAVIMIYLTFGGGLWEIAGMDQRWYRDLVAAWDKLAAKRASLKEEASEKQSSDSETSASAAALEPLYPSYEPFKRAIKTPMLRRLLLQMLHPDPQQRIPITEVAGNRWFRNIDCCQPESYEEPKPFDASKQGKVPNKVCCHNHLPPSNHGMTMPSLGKMPGHAGY